LKFVGYKDPKICTVAMLLFVDLQTPIRYSIYTVPAIYWISTPNQRKWKFSSTIVLWF